MATKEQLKANSESTFRTNGQGMISAADVRAFIASLIESLAHIEDIPAPPTIPDSLPANGGNADTVGGLGPGAFLQLAAGGTVEGFVNFAGGAGTTSDMRLKKDVVDVEPVLSILLEAPVFHFVYTKTGRKSLGSSAQWWEERFPDIVYKSPDGFLFIEENKIGILALKALQEETAKRISLEKKVDKLVKRIETLEQS